MANTQINDILMDVLNGAQSGDPQAMLIAGLSAALILILLLMVIIAIMGRKSGKIAENTANAPAKEPQIQKEEMADMPPTAASQLEKSSAAVDSADAIEQTDDFMIFKRSERPVSPRKEEVMPSSEELSIEDHLQIIEREMIKLRDMFKQGHVTRDVYVDETRNLYHQARAIAALR